MKMKKWNEMVAEKTSEMTEPQFERTGKMLKKIADEKLSIRFMSNTFNCFGSELATLRLWHHYTKGGTIKDVRLQYSKNMKSWLFQLENIPLSGDIEQTFY